MKKCFSTEFFKSIKKIPTIENAKQLSLSFSIQYSKKENEEPKNVITVNYNKKNSGDVYLLIQSPKKEVMKNLNLSKLKIKNIKGKKVYIGYEPKIRFFRKKQNHNLYTLVTKEDVITISTDDETTIESLKTSKPIVLKNEILSYVKKIPDQINGFEKCFAAFNSKEYISHFFLLFMTNTGTKVSVDIFEDEKEVIDGIVRDVIIQKKKIDKFTMKGSVGGKDLFFCKLNKNRLLTVRHRSGDKTLLKDFTMKLCKNRIKL